MMSKIKAGFLDLTPAKTPKNLRGSTSPFVKPIPKRQHRKLHRNQIFQFAHRRSCEDEESSLFFLKRTSQNFKRMFSHAKKYDRVVLRQLLEIVLFSKGLEQ